MSSPLYPGVYLLLIALVMLGCQPGQQAESAPDAASESAAEPIPEESHETTLPESHGETQEEPPPESTGPMRCNGAAYLCQRSYAQVAYLTTHNAMSNAEEKWQIPNQNHTVIRQLDNGVRALMLDVHDHEGQPYLCHGPCLLGKKPLVDGLKELLTWMQAHPHEVITIIFEMTVSASAIEADFRTSGLDALVHSQPQATPWPTLGALVASKRPLIVFTDKDGGTYPWYHDVWKYAWETHYSAKSEEDFRCTINRGNKDNALFIFNHFLTNPVAMSKFAEKVNKNPLLQDRVKQCQQESGRFPNFITVDFYDIGDAKAVVDGLNAP